MHISTAKKIIETIEAAIATAYKKDYGQKGQKIKAKFNPVSGDVKFWQVKLVVDDSMLYTEQEIEEMKDIKLATRIIRVRVPFLDGLRRMYVVENQSREVLAAALITTKIDNFVYSLGGVTQKGRDTQAGDFLIWNLIKDAKDLGYTTFDLGGIYADWADDTKKKVNEFKTRWGGEKVQLDISNRK